MKVKLVLVVVLGLALITAAASSLLVASASAAINLNSSKSNIYKVTSNSLEPVQAKINQLKEDPAVKRIKVDCVVTTDPFSITCTITWQRTQSGLGTEATTTPTKSNTKDMMGQNKSK